MAKVLDTILKVLGVLFILIAVLVILSIIVLLLRVLKPQQAESPSSTVAPETAYWYDPYWDWLNYPYYWFYPNERRHHRYHNDNHHSAHPPAPTVTTAPTSGVLPTLLDVIPTIPDVIPDVTINASLVGSISGPVVNPPSAIQPPTSEPVINPVFPIAPVVNLANQVVEGFENGGSSTPEPWSNISSLPELL
jgi:hypothetical protein